MPSKSPPTSRPLILFAHLEGDRRRDILLAAAAQFSKKGYKGTIIRDIAESVGVLGGSLYHHFKSKDELFLEVHGEALNVAAEMIEAAMEGLEDPWEQFEAACVAHATIQLDPSSVTMPMMVDLPVTPEPIRKQLIAQRDAFERRTYRKIVDKLPLDPAIDRSIFRITVLTLLNSLASWYRPGRLTPAEIGAQIVEIYRSGGFMGQAPVAKPRKRPAPGAARVARR